MKEQPFSKETLTHFFEGSLPEAEHTTILNWFSSLTKDEQLEFMDLQLVVLESRTDAPSQTSVPDFAFIETKIYHKKRFSLTHKLGALKIAAAILPFLIGYLIFQQSAPQHKATPGLTRVAVTRTIRIKNLLNKTEDIQLPDSTIVSLYPGAALNYPEGLKGKNRAILLSGKAFLKVKHDEHRPFTVKTGAITTVVLGTSFWIDARENARTISVKVKTGKVGVVYRKEPAIFLLPTEKAVFNTISGVLAKVKPAAAKKLAHEEQLVVTALAFNETPLKQVIKVLAENFHIRINLQETIDTNLPVSLNTKDKTLEMIMHDIQSQIPISYDIKKNEINIKQQD